MSGAGKMGDRGGGRESTKSLNKSKQTKHKIEIDQKKAREQYLLTRPKYSLTPQSITMPTPEDNLQPMLDVSCHLLSRSFNRDLIAVMRRAKESGVVGCILHCDWTRVTELMSLVKQWPGQMFAIVGVSPDVIKKNNDKIFESRMDQLLDLALQKETVAISCGLDLTRDLSTHFLQAKLFGAQVALAKQVKLPVMIWEKAAAEQICDQLQQLKSAGDIDRPAASSTSSNPHGKPDPIVISSSTSTPFPKVAIHHFNGTAADLERYLKNDCYIIVNGLVCDVKAAGEAASSSSGSAAELKAKQQRDEAAKADRAAAAAAEGGEEEELEEEEEHDEIEESDGTGFKAQTLVGPPDLTGSGAHLFHLIRSGLLPLDRLMVSTDAPLHTPQNITDFYIRTSRNEPSNMHHIFLSLAKAYNLPIAEVQAKVFATSKEFFGLLNQDEAKIEEEKVHEKERAKQAEEKKLLDREKRNEAEERKKKEREKREKEEAVEKETGAGKRKNKQKSEAPAAAPTTTADSDDEEDGGKKKKRGGKQQEKSAAKKPVAADSDDDSDAGWGKGATKNKKVAKKQAIKAKTQQKKSAQRTQESDDDEESDEEEVEVKIKTKKEKEKEKAAAAAKAKSKQKEESDESESEEEAPKSKKPAPAKKVTKKESSSEESESDEEPTPSAKSKSSTTAAKKPTKKEESSESESSSSEDEAPAKKKPAKKVVSSSESDSDSEPETTKKSAESIAAAKRARVAAIKEKQLADKIARKEGATVGKKKTKGKVGGDEEVDELDELFMAQKIDGLDAAAAEAKRKLEAKQAAAASSSTIQPDEVENELVQFRCRKCQAKLFTNEQDLGHDEASVASAVKDYSACEQIFIQPPTWLSQDTLDNAKVAGAPIDLLCFKCNAKIGRVSTSAPLLCACGRHGAGSSPYVSAKLSRLDAVTTSAASIKGPRAFDADELDKARADADENHERLRANEKERLKQKDKVKKASLMPVVSSLGNFTQFRNKMAGVAGDGKKKKREYQPTEEED